MTSISDQSKTSLRPKLRRFCHVFVSAGTGFHIRTNVGQSMCCRYVGNNIRKRMFTIMQMMQHYTKHVKQVNDIHVLTALRKISIQFRDGQVNKSYFQQCKNKIHINPTNVKISLQKESQNKNYLKLYLVNIFNLINSF